MGLVDRGHRLSRQKLSVEQRDSVASLTSREENVLEVGRVEATMEEKRVGDRLRWKETIHPSIHHLPLVRGSGRGGSSFNRETQTSLSPATSSSSSGGTPRRSQASRET